MSDRQTAARLAPVKVNLTLHVGPRRQDGYHAVDTLCFFPEIGDRLALGARADAFELVVQGPRAHELSGVPPHANLALRAARLLAGRTSLVPRRLVLTKTVPSASGIAGGTADAAAALVLLNETAEDPLPRGALIALSRALGADGPVCTAGQLAGGGLFSAQGDGERVTRLGSAPPLTAVLVNDGTAVPTGPVFRRFDAHAPEGKPLGQAGGDLRRTSGLVNAAREGRNDLRAPALAAAPSIGAIEEDLRQMPGCLFARMSGSGATVFGLFSSATAAERAARRQRSRGNWAACGRLLPGHSRH